jgi:pyruvate dehydrogenase E1 component
VSTVLGPDGGPIVAASDWMKTIPQLVAPWVSAPFVALGTDGYGRSDTRESLRAFFEVDAPSIAAAAMTALASSGAITAKAAAKAIGELGVDPDKVDPLAI